MLRISKGNMYDWVTHMHSHLAGVCPHKCSYCYVQRNRYGVAPRYQGDLRFIYKELEVHYGKGKTIFIEHMNDMFATQVYREWIGDIFDHCARYPDNNYVFQTKNPGRALCWHDKFPRNSLVGVTIETNRNNVFSKAPKPVDRYEAMRLFKQWGARTFVTIEPIMDFDIEILVYWLKEMKPEFVNIGADSKRSSLPEPSPSKVSQLVRRLQAEKIFIKKKINLQRLLK